MLSRLFPRRAAEPKPLPQPDAQLALGALLVRIALADNEYQQAEVAAIDRILACTFDLGPIEAAKLRAVCTDLEMHGADPDEFARILRSEVSYGEREGLVRSMWQVLLADDDHAEIEERKLHQIEAALGIAAEDSAKLRTEALGTAGSAT